MAEKGTNGKRIKPSPKRGPGLNLRARSKAQIQRLHKAAASMELSMNTYVMEVLDRAMDAQGVPR